MSELKAISSGEIYEIIEYEDCFRTDDLYYPKSEADKVIAEKDADIAQLQAMLEERNKQIGELKEERRWRKASEELPTDGDAVAVSFHTEEGKLVTSVDCCFDEEWQMMDDCEGYWIPLPKSPKETK